MLTGHLEACAVRFSGKCGDLLIGMSEEEMLAVTFSKGGARIVGKACRSG